MEQYAGKIAVVANTAWNIVNFRLGLIVALIENGYDIVVIAPEDEYVSKIEATGCKFIPLQRLDRKGTNPVKDLRLTHELYRIYKREKFDLVLHYTIKPNIYGTFAASFAGVKAICTVTGLGYSFLSDNWISRLAKNLYKRAFKRAVYVAFQNDDDRQLFILQNLVTADKTMLIRGSGIKCDYFCPLPKTETSENFIFLFVGRLLLDKGIREYLNAAAEVRKSYPKTEFWAVGALDTDNPSCIDSDSVADAQQKGLLRYFGPSDEVREFVRNADVVLLPSYREGLPRVMLEAISMAKPIITTDTAGCRDTVIDGINGYMVPVKDWEALAAAMKKMLEADKDTLNIMGEEGRKLALREFDEKMVVKRYIDVIAYLIAKGNAK